MTEIEKSFAGCWSGARGLKKRHITYWGSRSAWARSEWIFSAQLVGSWCHCGASRSACWAEQEPLPVLQLAQHCSLQQTAVFVFQGSWKEAVLHLFTAPDHAVKLDIQKRPKTGTGTHNSCVCARARGSVAIFVLCTESNWPKHWQAKQQNKHQSENVR